MGNVNSELLLELEACETRVWQALALGDKNADEKAIHRDFLGVYPDGFATKADHVGQLEKGATIGSFELSDSRVILLGSDHVLFSYRATYLKKGKTFSETMYVSSVWRRAESGWVNIFSQDTPASE